MAWITKNLLRRKWQVLESEWSEIFFAGVWFGSKTATQSCLSTITRNTSSWQELLIWYPLSDMQKSFISMGHDSGACNPGHLEAIEEFWDSTWRIDWRGLADQAGWNQIEIDLNSHTCFLLSATKVTHCWSTGLPTFSQEWPIAFASSPKTTNARATRFLLESVKRACNRKNILASILECDISCTLQKLLASHQRRAIQAKIICWKERLYFCQDLIIQLVKDMARWYRDIRKITKGQNVDLDSFGWWYVWSSAWHQHGS